MNGRRFFRKGRLIGFAHIDRGGLKVLRRHAIAGFDLLEVFHVRSDFEHDNITSWSFESDCTLVVIDYLDRGRDGCRSHHHARLSSGLFFLRHHLRREESNQK